MCAIILLLLGFAGFFGFTGLRSATIQTVEVPMEATAVAVELPEVISCESVSEDQDIRDMFALVGDAFEPTAWVQEVGVSGNGSKTTVTWRSAKYGAVAYLEYLHYDCGVSQSQIDDYYSPEGFDTLLSNYSSHELTAECENEDVHLFEFAATSNDQEYHILYWVERVSPTRVAGLMLVFPASYPAQQAEYAGRLFSQLSTCEEAAG
jgi:hypothetical protein